VKVRLADLDLDDGQAALRINRHHVRASSVRQRHFANREQLLAEEEAGDAARHLGRNRRRIGETAGIEERIGRRAHARFLEQKGHEA
jgi:hypothetical protein